MLRAFSTAAIWRSDVVPEARISMMIGPISAALRFALAVRIAQLIAAPAGAICRVLTRSSPEFYATRAGAERDDQRCVEPR